MDYLKENLDEYQTVVHSLHYLLTEKETDQSKIEVVNVFKKALIKIVEILKIYLKKDFDIEIDDPDKVFEQAQKVKLFNETTYEAVKRMILDMNKSKSNFDQTVYYNIKNEYARILQVFHDILRRMGEEATEDDDN